MRLIGSLIALAILAACSRAESPEGASMDGGGAAQVSVFDPKELGTVDFPVSCTAAAAAGMEHGLALLHHMAYTESDLVFQTVLEEDSSCGMG